MRFYSQVILPRLCNLLLNTPQLARQRHDLLARAQGNVLEIGFGTGLNLPHYPARVHRISTVDPNSGMLRLARRRIQNVGIEVIPSVQSSERLPFDDGTFDCAVSTFVLCSIHEVEQALAEVHRVLVPGGEFLFLEHGLSPEPSVQKWQRRLNWLQMRLGDGCRLDRNIKALLAAQPFSSVEVREFYLEGTPSTHGYIYRGIATK